MAYDILKNRTYLYLTEFFAGMAVMAVELGASRLLAPYFSSSQIVWTIIIGTIMIAMALGNLFGGKWADQDPNPARLFRRLLIAAVWIAAIPFLGRYIIVGITGLMIVTIDTNLLIWSAFLACMIIFVYPLFLLGTVTPSLIKYTVSSLDESGSIAGRLGACNTIGSILGTFLPTFVTIPAVGTAMTFLFFSGILLILGLVYFISVGGRRILCTVMVMLFALCSLFGARASFAFWESDLTYEGESIYNYLQVKDTEDATILSTNVLYGVQSIRPKDETLTGMYYDYALAAPVLSNVAQKGADADILILGMGTGTFAEQCRRYFPDANISGVEIDEQITELATSYFELPEDISVTTYDGRAYLAADEQKYDVIMVDAYQDITIPFQMSSVEFFTMVREHLKDDGVMVVNFNMHSDTPDDITVWLTDTIGSVFDNVQAVDVIGSTNRELFATQDETLFEHFNQRAMAVEDEELRRMMRAVNNQFTSVEVGDNIFTDDQAPVELLGMRTIDALITNEVSYYKNILREEGISGLMEAVS